MPDIRVAFSVSSSYGTAFQADTIFGHLCWAAAYTEGDKALGDFLAAFETKPPLLVSDAFPAARDGRFKQPVYYLPKPTLPPQDQDLTKLEEFAGSQPDRNRLRLLSTAVKAIDKKPFVSESVLITLSNHLSWKELTLAFLRLEICPMACVPRAEVECQCTDWASCPGLGTSSDLDKCKQPPQPSEIMAPVLHNVINRWSNTSENLFTMEERFPTTDFHFIARLDDSVMTIERFKTWVEYMALFGFGRDATTGKGSLRNLSFEPFKWENQNAHWFLNISSAYVPRKGELAEGTYQVHLKRGKIGGTYVLSHSPWKKPILMIRSGAVFKGSPTNCFGQLVRNVHYTLPQVVQYGYAFPLGVNTDA